MVIEAALSASHPAAAKCLGFLLFLRISVTITYIFHEDILLGRYPSCREGTSGYDLLHNGRNPRFYIPNDIMQVFDDEFDYREIVNWQELTDTAVALFVGLTALDTVSTGSGGGGSSNDDNWRDCKDEDEIERARRCVRAAAASLCKTPKSGRKR